MWLACWTLQEIADDVGMTAKGVSEVIEEMASLPKLQKPQQVAADHATGFDPPIYNVWKLQEALRKEDAKKNTQKVVAGLLGVARETMRDWFRTKGETANASKPVPDARSSSSMTKSSDSPPIGF